MERYYLKIAGFIIEIIFDKKEIFTGDHLKEEIKKYLKGFFVRKEKINAVIKIKENLNYRLFFKKEVAFLEFYKKINKYYYHSYYQINIFQLLFIIREIVLQLLEENQGFILHASSCLINKEGYLFLGSSGAGKSTIINLIKNKKVILSDDQIIVKRERGKYYLYQTPFLEKNQYQKSFRRYRLGKIFFIVKDKKKKIMKLKKDEKLIGRLTNQLWLREKLKNFSLIIDFFKKNDFYQLNFNQKSFYIL